MLALPLTGSTPELYHGKYVAGMYGSGEQGVWYEPSLSNGTLFQDAAGTTPVTAVEQPVGLMKDKSGRGNHAKQTTSADRPVFSARYNFVQSTDDITISSWGSNRLTKYKGLADPDGGTAACSIYETVETGTHWMEGSGITVPINTTIKRTVYLKYAGVQYVMFGGDQNRVDRNICVDLITGTIVASGTYVLSSSITAYTGGWWKIETLTNTLTSSAPGFPCAISLRQTIGSGGESYTGDPTKGVLIWRPSCVPANQAHLPYQRVNTATGYDADPVKFPPYLKFNGTNSWMVTNSIDFTGTDKMTVFAGVRKLSDANSNSLSVITELSINLDNNNGAFSLFASNGWSNPKTTAQFIIKGTVISSAYTQLAIYSAPITSVMVGLADTSGDIPAKLRINGMQVSQSTTNPNTINLGNYPLYIGRRGGATNPFNGQIYSLIIRGAATDDAHLTHTEKFIAYKTGVTL